MPSIAKLKLSRRDIALRRLTRTLFPLLHLRSVPVAEQMQQSVHERSSPCVPGDLRAHDGISELARQPRRQVVAAVDGERQHVRRLIDP